MNNAYITRIVHSRGFGITVALIAAFMATIYTRPSLDLLLSLIANGVTVVVMLLLNKIFNIFRSMTSLFIAFYAMMQLASPDILVRFNTGNMLAIVVPGCMMLLYSCYRQPEATRRIFLINFLLSAFAATQYCYAFYIPAFLLGCGQMRIFNRRTVCAAIMGIVTPWMLYLGFGIIAPEDIIRPQMSILFSEIDLDEALVFAVCLGVTMLLLLLSYALNVMRTIAYNARARAVNGCLTVVSLVTLVVMCIDYRNIINYVPMFNFCAAMELTHYFATHRANKSYIAIISIIAVYAAIYVCQTVI